MSTGIPALISRFFEDESLVKYTIFLNVDRNPEFQHDE